MPALARSLAPVARSWPFARRAPAIATALCLASASCARRAEPSGALPASSASTSDSADATAEGDAPEDASADAIDDAAPETEPAPRLAARTQIAWVHERPVPGSQKLGYLRTGGIVEREEKAASDEGCSKGWYAIQPRGYVCVGETATLDLDDPIVVAASTRRPSIGAPLPYAYGIAKNSIAPFYTRIPTFAESAKLEMDFEQHMKNLAYAADAGPEYDAGNYADAPPSFLQDARVVPNVSGLIGSSRALYAGRPRAKEGFAIVESFVSGPGGDAPDGGASDRRFDLTTDYLLLPHDRLRAVRPSEFHGVALDEATTLPIAFTRPRHHLAKIWLGAGAPKDNPVLPPRTAVPLTGESRRVSGEDYYATTDGAFLKGEDVIRVDTPKSWPAFANKGERWIDVSIAHQSLVAYEGTKPVYVTLVSTGRDGLGDPESTHATIRGVYRIGTKHVSVTMDSDESGEEFSLRDVPYVQYFDTGYALHGAYWHDGFGEPRSHGCINLSETDAAWLFLWTGPELPTGWHGVMARPLATGTQLWIHV